MTMGARNEVFERYKNEYAKGRKRERSIILDTVCETTGLHRKAAVRKFGRLTKGRKREYEHRGRPTKYGKDVDAALYDVWEIGAFCCAELLRGEVSTYIEALTALGKWRYGDVTTGLLRALSLGEMKRRIGGLRERHRIKGRTSTTPSTIKKKVRVYAGPWRNRGPGHRQFDSVVHCGDRLQGDMVYTINGVDPAIMYVEQSTCAMEQG